MPCRAILDSASQVSFITSRLVNQLNLNHRRSQTSISGIGQSSMISDKTVHILVQSRDASYRAVVTRSVTDFQPHFNINATSWRIPQNISLADPNFNQSQRIDILLGAGMFFEIISMEQIHLDRALPTPFRTPNLVGQSLEGYHRTCQLINRFYKPASRTHLIIPMTHLPP